MSTPQETISPTDPVALPQIAIERWAQEALTSFAEQNNMTLTEFMSYLLYVTAQSMLQTSEYSE